MKIDLSEDIHSFFKEPFNRYLIGGLVILGLLLLLWPTPQASQCPPDTKLVMDYFYSPSCPHCAAQKPFNEQLLEEFPGLCIVPHDVTIPSEMRLLEITAQNHSIDTATLGTPTSFIGNRVVLGFESVETTGSELRSAIKDCMEGECEIPSPSAPANVTSLESITRSVTLPLFGKTDLSSFSLPALAIVLGLTDGFNPCAMWVLVYLISLVMGLRDKRRLVLIIGTFVAASGVLYFLFMTAWLNAFLLLGYARPVTILVGLIALGGGIVFIRDFITTKGAMTCKVIDVGNRKKLMQQMKETISAPLTIATLFAMIVLAFVVNSVEFVCSAALPAVFTQVLALSKLSSLEHYLYIALYDFFYMFDDLLVFGSAVLIFNNIAGEKYEKYCRVISGTILLILGLMLLFAPNMLA